MPQRTREMQPSSENQALRVEAIANADGLHARLAGDIVRSVSRFSAVVFLEANGRRASATSILQLLALGASGGARIQISASGAQASEAVSEVAELLAELG